MVRDYAKVELSEELKGVQGAFALLLEPIQRGVAEAFFDTVEKCIENFCEHGTRLEDLMMCSVNTDAHWVVHKKASLGYEIRMKEMSGNGKYFVQFVADYKPFKHCV